MRDLPPDLAPYLEAELLHPGWSAEQIQGLCQEADRLHLAAVCVHPHWVKQVREWLYRRPIALATVVGFPLGLNCQATKLFEAQLALEQGATELDLVLNPAWIRAAAWDPLFTEIAAIREAAQVPIKGVLDMEGLTPEQVAGAVDVCLQAGVSYLKGSTTGPARLEHVQQLAQLSQGKVGIKASGQIKTAAQVEAFWQAGATRIGTSKITEILAAWGSP
ncbi:MAG: deoxyribose-phosphate aldolase [Thermostichales cyanobacterium BF4_bins_65]